MKCKICGTELADGAKVCSVCDTRVSTPAASDRRRESKFGRVIKRFDFKSESKSVLISQIISCVISLFLATRCFSAAGNARGYFMSDVREGLSLLGALLLVFAVLDIVYALLHKHLYDGRFLSVNEFGLVGIGAGQSVLGFLDLKNEHYEAMYDDIVSIQKAQFGTTLCINTENNKINITLPAKRQKEAIQEIERASGITIAK